MNVEQLRARLGEISARLTEIEAGKEGYTKEQLAEIDTLGEEFSNLTNQLDAAEKVASIQAKASATGGRKTVAAAPVGGTKVEIVKDHTDRFGGFKNSGEFLMAVKDFHVSGKVASQFQSAAYEKSGEDGGFLVPEDISTAIVKKLDTQESLLSSATQLRLSGNTTTINVDESQPWNGGVVAYWVAEGGAITQSKPVFKQASFRLQKVAALVSATDEMLDDAAVLESVIKTQAPEAMMNKINGAMIAGNGIGKPTGIIGSGFTIEAAKEVGQVADTVVAKNIIKMYSRLFPQARLGAAWYMNAAVEEQLLGMVDENDNYIYLAPGSQLNQTPYGLLMGRPVIPMMSAMPALGDSGDILLGNMKYYYAALKANGGVKSAESIHLYFDTEKTAFRFSFRVDGKVPFQTPVTTEFGSYQMSAFVKLEAR